jgi:hypothetical protein
MNVVREAVSTLSWSPPRQPRRRQVTTDFGWNADSTAYLAPGGAVTAEGFVEESDPKALDVDLRAEEHACYLGLLPPGPAEELLEIKHHVVQDLLRLHDRRITFSLLGATAAAVLGRFVPDADPFALGLVGMTGAGKSFLARLFTNFFGDFLVGSGRFPNWNSTANFLQRQGYYFKDALYLIDDYKPEVVRHQDAVRILQNYSDRAGRGRLKVDATTNTSRPIRGLLVSTGEDIPEHTASSMARSIIVPVPQQEKLLDVGQRCQTWSRHYRRLTADFIRHILTQDRGKHFAFRYFLLRRHFYEEIAGAQNDSRIAGNLELAEFSPSPLVGEGGGGGWKFFGSKHFHPPPQPSPTRGEGVLSASS